MPVPVSSDRLPRLPLEAAIDLTYRCDNACRHCWLWRADTAEERARELSTQEWLAVIDQARELGVREWSISGGEPMLREDFSEIFEHATSRSVRYTLNTNGTLITPAIARLLRREGVKLIAVYGATADVYDRVTRHPGGFDALLEGLARLKEAHAGFVVQLVPMRDNWGQWDEMVAFAKRWSIGYRVGAAWLHLSACRGEAANAEIERQRLEPADVVRLDPPDVTRGDGDPARDGVDGSAVGAAGEADDRLYAACLAHNQGFHVDAYGALGLCSSIKDPALRFDLRDSRGAAANRHSIRPGAVQSGWDRFLPALSDSVRGGTEYLEACAACELRGDCRWCDAYGYLERGRHGARVDYLCAVAAEANRYKREWAVNHRRFFGIAGITVRVDSDLPFAEDTMDPKFERFRVDGPGPDTVAIRHHFELPSRDGSEDAEEVYHKEPWTIYRSGQSWIYHSVSEEEHGEELYQVARFTRDYSQGEIFNEEGHREVWERGGVNALTMFPSDQLLLAQLLAQRGGCYLHSGAVALDGQGLAFGGHSGAGKSTTLRLLTRCLGERVEVLCDDRNIVRAWPEGYDGGGPGFYVHGTWSHGDLPECCGRGVPLRAVLILEQSTENEIVPLADARASWRALLGLLIRPLLTADWCEKELDVLQGIVAEVPCFTMRFDGTDAIVPEIERLVT